jgi:uncharacterized protein YukE
MLEDIEQFQNVLKAKKKILLTFGFSIKEQSKIVEEMRASVNVVVDQIQNVEKEVHSAQSNLQDLTSQAEAKIDELQSQYEGEVSQKVKSSEQLVRQLLMWLRLMNSRVSLMWLTSTIPISLAEARIW